MTAGSNRSAGWRISVGEGAGRCGVDGRYEMGGRVNELGD